MSRESLPAGTTCSFWKKSSALPAGKLSGVQYDEKEIGATSAMAGVTRIALGPESRQSTYALSCGWLTGAPSPAFVTTQQIYNAIGGKYFTMNLLR